MEKIYDKPFKTINTPIEQWNHQFGHDLDGLYRKAIRTSLSTLCRDVLWGLLAVGVYCGLAYLLNL